MRETSSVALVVCIIFIGGALSAQTASPREDPVSIYTNRDYGYMVTVPNGLRGWHLPYDAHGFRIEIPGSPATIRVTNSYNMEHSTLLPDIWAYQVNTIGQCKDWAWGDPRDEKIAGLDAMRIVATYARNNTQWFSEYHMIYRPRDQRGYYNIVYTIELSGPLSLYRETQDHLKETIAGFAIFEVTDSPPPKGEGATKQPK